MSRLEQIRARLQGRTQYEGRPLADDEWLLERVDELAGLLRMFVEEDDDECRSVGLYTHHSRRLREAARAALKNLGGGSDAD